MPGLQGSAGRKSAAALGWLMAADLQCIGVCSSSSSSYSAPAMCVAAKQTGQ